MVFGHRPIGWAPGFELRHPLYIVTLREPIAFALSLFDFIQHNSFKAHDRQRASFANKTFSENVVSGNEEVLSYVRDKQSELLKGLDGCANTDKKTCVLSNLDKAHVVAVAERLDDVLIQLRWVTGWLGLGVDSFPRTNSAEVKSPVTPRAMKILEAQAENGVDALLYQTALERHEILTDQARRCLPFLDIADKSRVSVSATSRRH